MFRASSKLAKLVVQGQKGVQVAATRNHTVTWKPVPLNDNPLISHHVLEAEETDEEFDQRFVDYFNREDLDGWMLRKGLTELHKYDVIPEPRIVVAALRAMRRINDYALTTRFLETIKFKCGPKAMRETIYPYIVQEIRPVLEELGISTPEELGFDKPELWHPNADWWEKEMYAEYGLDKNPFYIIDGKKSS